MFRSAAIVTVKLTEASIGVEDIILMRFVSFGTDHDLVRHDVQQIRKLLLLLLIHYTLDK